MLFCVLSFRLRQQMHSDKFFDSNGVGIRYVERGSGEPVVLVHGFGENVEGQFGTNVLPNLARDHRVIALDCRGHGKSDKPHDPEQYGPHMGADIVRLLDQLGIPKAHIVGYSMGAAITAQLLTMNPERFLTATLGGAGGRLRWSAEENRMIDREAAEIEQGTLRSLILRLTPPSEPKPTDEEIRKISEAFLAGQDRLALAAVKRSYRNQAVTEAQMAAVKVPTLGIIGSADPSMAMMNVQKEAMPTLKVVIIGGATHGGERAALRRPEFVKAIREFI